MALKLKPCAVPLQTSHYDIFNDEGNPNHVARERNIALGSKTRQAPKQVTALLTQNKTRAWAQSRENRLGEYVYTRRGCVRQSATSEENAPRDNVWIGGITMRARGALSWVRQHAEAASL
jgi:hypothetical protein